jgi:hypothetical protein
MMTAEIVPLRPPTRIVGEHLRCRVCGRGTYTNVVSQTRWSSCTRTPRTAPAVVNPGMQRETHSRVCSEGTSALPRGLREHLQLTPPAPTREPPGPSGGVGARREHQQPHLCHGPPAPAGTTIRGANAALRRGGYSWAPATIQRCLPALPTSCSPMGPTSTVSSSPR